MTSASPRLRSSSQTAGKARRRKGSGSRPAMTIAHDEAVGEGGVERPVLRLQVEGEAALLAPALQVHQPVPLPGRVTLVHRKAAGLGEDAPEEHRLVVHAKPMP